MSPFEVVAGELLPGQAAVGGSPGGLLEAAGVQNAGIVRVDGDVVDVLVFGEDAPPGLAGVGGEIDAAIGGAFARTAAPGGQVEALGVARIDGDPIGAVQACGQRDSRPVLGTIGGAVQSAVARVAGGA